MRSLLKLCALSIVILILFCPRQAASLAQDGGAAQVRQDAAGLLSHELPEALPEAQKEFIRRHSFDDAEFRRKQQRRRSGSSDPGAQPAGQSKEVRMIYLVPSDKSARADYEIAVQNAILHLQAFYRDQLANGQTFSVHTPVVEVYKTSHTAAFYSTGQNADTFGFWESVLADGFALTGGGFDDSNNRWLFYVDAQPGCGQFGGGGTNGVATLPSNDLRGLTGQSNVPQCPGEQPDTFGVCRWVGGLGHELGHAFNLPHPPGCDQGGAICGSFQRNSLMYQGYAFFSDTYLLDSDKSSLMSTGFFAPFNLATPGASFCASMTGQSPNPINDAGYFVRWNYKDFLTREPDDAGAEFWKGVIESCGQDAQCREVKRIDTSAAFFLSIEFQETGYLVYRAYQAAYGDTVSSVRDDGGNSVPYPVPAVRRADFVADAPLVGQGVVVNATGWEQQLESNKRAFMLAFVQRQRFTTAFPASMTADEFVTRLDQNAGGVLSPSEKSDLIFALGPTPSDPQKRALVLRAVAEDADFEQREVTRAFVLMQYFGYLRRDPNSAQDADHSGYKFWLDKLNSFGGDHRRAEMVKAFIASAEYRGRFGQP